MPSSMRWVAICSACVMTMIAAAFLLPPATLKPVRVAFIGNSVQYFNDFPRTMEAMANGVILQQDSCLRGNADFQLGLDYGNAMNKLWKTENALFGADDEDLLEFSPYYDTFHDFGACTPQQLLLGFDDRIESYIEGYEADDRIGMGNDGQNPCLEDTSYFYFLDAIQRARGAPEWDFVVLNDNTRSPCCTQQRARSLDNLEQFYIPWLLESGAIPVFISTFAYWAPDRDMSGLTDIPTFTSLTYNGNLEYIDFMSASLPPSQKPRLAPVGLAFLEVYDTNPSIWADLIHYDDVHPSPSGTFLQACVVFATIVGRMPSPEVVKNPASLWDTARRLQPDGEECKEFPDEERAIYLYNVAKRIVEGHKPKSLTLYSEWTSVDFVPDDSYMNNNLALYQW